jgi:Fur family ferric uptake transcriptional regulator
MVACVEPGDGQHRYELLGVHGPHIHLVCQGCNAVIGVERDAAQPLADRLLVQHGFVVALDRLAIPGLCRQCSDRTTKAD